MPIVDSQTYSRNIEALRARQPEVASAIDAAIGPPARLVIGRDGSPTFLISGEGGENWLGGSSMPSVSAEELFRGFAGGHENVFVPGIMSGREVLELAGRLSRHAAVFIIERSAYYVQLALRLYDFGGLIARGQVVILLESEFETQLLALFQRFPGYLLPSRLLTIAHRSPVEHAELQRRIERSGVQLARQQAEMASRLTHRLEAGATPGNVAHLAPADDNAKGPAHRVAILSTDASDFTREDARRLTAALDELRWPNACCIPDCPEHCHAIARLKCMDELAADQVIMVNSPPRSLRTLAPEGTPIISWYFASARIPTMIDAALNPADSFVVTSKAQQAQLASGGVAEEKVYYAGITVGPLADSETSFGIERSAWQQTRDAISGENKSPSREEPAFDALVAGDVPDDRPEAAGISMSTHATLWRECVKIAADYGTKNKTVQAAELLALAEQHCGAKLSDPKIRGEMIQKIDDRVLPAAFARQLARDFASRFKVAFAGANWPNGQMSSPPAGATSSAKRARWIVLPFFSTAAIQTAVDVLAGGGCVALRAGHTPLAEAHPELRNVAKLIPTFTNAKQAVEIVGRAKSWSDDETRSALESLSLSAVLSRVAAQNVAAHQH